MAHPRTLTSSALGSLLVLSAVLPVAAQTYVRSQDYVTPQTYMTPPDYVGAQEYAVAGNRQLVGSRCTDFGSDFIDMGNGICGRVGSTSRVQLGTRSAGMSEWRTATTTSATLRAEGLLPGAAVQHLRVRGYAPGSPLQ